MNKLQRIKIRLTCDEQITKNKSKQEDLACGKPKPWHRWSESKI